MLGKKYINFYQNNRFEVVAIVGTIMVHAVILTRQLVPPNFAQNEQENEISVLQVDLISPLNQTERKKSEPPVNVEQQAQPENTEPINDSTNSKDAIENTILSAQEVFIPSLVSNKTNEVNPVIVIPSVYSDSFNQLINEQTQRHIGESPNRLSSFSGTFVAPQRSIDIPAESKEHFLGGGTSKKTRSNGVECVHLQFVPQTFDDISNGSISTGRCKKLSKFELTDKDGKIKNSSRYD